MKQNQIQQQWLRQHRRLEGAASVRNRRLFRSWVNNAMQSLADSWNSGEILFAPEIIRVEFNRLWRPMWLQFAGTGFEFEKALIEQRQGLFSWGTASAAKAATWVAGKVGNFWQLVADGFRNQIVRLISKANSTDASDSERLKAVDDGMKKYAASQARQIARNQTTEGLNLGAQLARDELAIVKKVWLSTIDNVTRTGQFNHVEPNGQTRRNDQMFIVSGETLLYPGDGSHGASFGNLVNCRCVSTAEMD